MFLRILHLTLFKFALLLVVGGILVLGIEVKAPLSVSAQPSYQSEATAATLHCNANAICDLILSK